jgi:hypothetical protein
MGKETRKQLKGDYDRADACKGFASLTCRESTSMGVECEQGACHNRLIQRRAFVRTKALPNFSGSWGLYLDDEADIGELVEEYCGEIISREEFWKRFNQTKPGDPLYFCEFEKDWIIDSAIYGSYGRFVQHSCNPNASLEKRLVKGQARMVFQMICEGKTNDAVTIDYAWKGGVLRHKCECGEPTCIGFIERLKAHKTDPAGAVEMLSRRDESAAGPSARSPDEAPDSKRRITMARWQDKDVLSAVKMEEKEDAASSSGGKLMINDGDDSSDGVECLGSWTEAGLLSPAPAPPETDLESKKDGNSAGVVKEAVNDATDITTVVGEGVANVAVVSGDSSATMAPVDFAPVANLDAPTDPREGAEAITSAANETGSSRTLEAGVAPTGVLTEGGGTHGDAESLDGGSALDSAGRG